MLSWGAAVATNYRGIANQFPGGEGSAGSGEKTSPAMTRFIFRSSGLSGAGVFAAGIAHLG